MIVSGTLQVYVYHRCISLSVNYYSEHLVHGSSCYQGVIPHAHRFAARVCDIRHFFGDNRLWAENAIAGRGNREGAVYPGSGVFVVSRHLRYAADPALS